MNKKADKKMPTKSLISPYVHLALLKFLNTIWAAHFNTGTSTMYSWGHQKLPILVLLGIFLIAIV